MYRKLAVLMAFVLVFAGAGVGQAAPPPAGSGPDNPQVVPSGPATLQVGQRVWYGFNYAGDGSQILVDMAANPGGSAKFGVWTADGVTNWQQGNGDSPIGNGTDNALMGDDLVWSGNFDAPGTYYVVVDQVGGSPANINLKVTGSGVSGLSK